MSTDWMDGWERIAANAQPGNYVDDAPWRIVLHSTEGDSFDAAISSYRSSTSWPHGTADPHTRRRGQHYPLSVSSRALMNQPGGVETNREHVIQIELVMRADDAGDLTDDQLEWIGTGVIRPIIDALDGAVALTAPAFVGREAGFIARPDAPQRFTYDAWRDFNGVCGHQHVPENDHWDPGHLDISKVLAAAGRPASTPPAPTPEDEPVKLMYVVKKGKDGKPAGAVYLASQLEARVVSNFADEESVAARFGHTFIPANKDDPTAPVTDDKGQTRQIVMVDNLTAFGVK